MSDHAIVLYTSSHDQAILKIVNGVYTIESPGGDLVMRRANGSEYAESSRYEFTAVEPKADGEGYVAILRLDDGRVSIREFDATGVQQSLTAPQAVEDVLDQEAALNIDINGDGVIHAIRHIEQDGNAALKIVNGVYTIELPDGDLVMRRGNGSEYAESSRYEFTAVEPKADGEGYAAILRLDDGRVSIREFDATGVQQNLTAPQAVEDVLDQEAALNIDINGDGVIHAIRHIEQDGNTALKIVNGVYTIESPDGDLVMRRGNGNEYAESSRYEFTAVEPKADGEGYVAILMLDDGRVSIREFDATGIQQSLTAPRAVEEVLDQEAALNIDINGDGKIGVNVESEPEFTQLRLELPLGDGWALGSNRISFDLIFPSVATLDDVSLQDGGALFISASSSSVGGVTTTRYSISASNGSADGMLELFFTVGNEDIDDLSAHIEALQVNGVSLGNTSFVSDGVSLFKYVPESAFTIVQETSEIDTIGYDTYYDNIFDALLALPNAQVGVIDSSTPTQAYINIEEGESFLFDHDAFELRAGESNNYRIKIIPENPSFFPKQYYCICL